MLRESVEFERLDTTADLYGNVSDGTWAGFLTVRGRIKETAGRERIEGGSLKAPMTGMLTVRSSTLTRAITEADRATINSVPWNIRGIRNPDERNRWLEMAVERDVAN